MWGRKVRHVELIRVTTFEHEWIMQRSQAANERCSVIQMLRKLISLIYMSEFCSKSLKNTCEWV